ncbi:RING-type E3 ubiquitin transferase [Plasmodiophora brassicae]|uniref:RING-type E3 ubiquitin transferase n=2 Tax=Plasmodiophora brassicae TaxID=37360 RepID=A0A3P3YBA4_PLABS|nr:unnamed protein product [Plasmodiophora brassicae]
MVFACDAQRIAPGVEMGGMADADVDDVGTVRECRVCRGGSFDDEPLYNPCLCRGSIKWVHQSCLQDWLAHRPRTDGRCELCRHPIAFAPIYASDAPESLSFVQVVTDLATRFIKCLPGVARSAVVAAAWLILVPLLTRFMLRACFRAELSWLFSVAAFRGVLPRPLTPLNLLFDFQTGILICSLIFVSVALMASFRDIFPDDFVPFDNREQAPSDEEPGVDDPFDPAFALLPAEQAPLPVAEPDEAGVFIEDMPLSQWLGFSGHWTVFICHFAFVLLCNFMVLLCAIFIPLRTGRVIMNHVWQIESSTLAIQILDGASTLMALALSENLVPDTDALRVSAIESFAPGSFFDQAMTIAVGFGVLVLSMSLFIIAVSSFGSAWSNAIGRFLLSAFLNILMCIKVAVLLAVELVGCPILFGIIIDVLTIGIRHTTLSARMDAFLASPSLSVLLFWFTGIALFLNLSVFASVLRQTVRREVYLVLFRDPEDPDFHPIQELVDKPLPRLIRSLVVSVTIYVVLLLLCLHVPTKMAVSIVPSVAPLTLRFSNSNEMPGDLVFLHFCLPFAIERIHSGRLHSRFVSFWLKHVCRLLSLSDFVLPRPVGTNQQPAAPSHLSLRVFLLFLLAWITYIVVFFACFVTPLLVGRAVLAHAVVVLTYHDMYAFLVGFNIFLGILWAIETAVRVCQRGDFAKMAAFLSKWIVFSGKVVAIMLAGGLQLPLMVGILFDLLVIIPVRVPVDQSPVVYLTQDWILGLVTLKICARLIRIGVIPSSRWRERIEHLGHMGVTGLDVAWVLTEIIWPVALNVGVHLAFPYVFARAVYPMLDESPRGQEVMLRFGFFVFGVGRFAVFLCALLLRWFCNLEKSLFNDRYLVGQRLLNHE